ncbi:MAG: UDP-N-acetylmuramate dehydrogenase [Candidatus Omnitrophica bacterium]|nr:UDP-N-acetylmuramate dehydrogenase [Candidatus Omnitrophota bacterium]
MNLQKSLRIKRNYPLKDITTIKIGGVAQFFSTPRNLIQLRAILSWADKKSISVFVIGAGSNLLVSDKGIKGIVLKLSSTGFKNIAFKGNSIKAGSGVTLASLVKFALSKSLSGIEFLCGIPGTLGGALIMNAGCWGKSIGDMVNKVEAMDLKGNIIKLSREDAKFGYRKSGLKNYILLSAGIRLKKGNREIIRRNIKDYLLKRRKSQDFTFYNAGCIFKNPKVMPAGKLIELCGLKGRAKGGAFISNKHANFILNKGKAKACDVLSLMKLMKMKVKRKFGVVLEPEIRVWR